MRRNPNISQVIAVLTLVAGFVGTFFVNTLLFGPAGAVVGNMLSYAIAVIYAYGLKYYLW